MASNMSQYLPQTRSQLKPRRHHGYSVVLFILGTLLPPLAVAARFGIGTDFWLNVILTICGYIPGHGHNFYIQNIRNNKTHARTPKWAQRYGLIDTTKIQRNERKSQWSSRYNDRLPRSTLEGAPYAEGQEQGSSASLSSDPQPTNRTQTNNGELWGSQDEQYYNTDNSSRSSGRWHYPANFDDAALTTDTPKKKKKSAKKDRWARTEDAYSITEEQSRKKRSKKKKSQPSMYSAESLDGPEPAEGGHYGPGGGRSTNNQQQQQQQPTTQNADDIFSHEF
ncbi:hypothetical protein MIND_01031200 [Mycena indigotica]|uniref:Stress response RCI peptide n=1 Tax=Mycena indigotica TaxID=2126181 RepID=A0A8H6VWY6_9AGAR|nr:uncharacterized protein MIND_01031200 [Mycena indigotica]KAF7294931.1 hypothetical protein MIND_01031200 [Mycena indigotica]